MVSETIRMETLLAKQYTIMRTIGHMVENFKKLDRSNFTVALAAGQLQMLNEC